MALDLDNVIAELETMRVAELHRRYTELFGEPATTRNRQRLMRRILYYRLLTRHHRDLTAQFPELDGLARLGHWIELDLINNPNLAPEVLAESFDGDNPCPNEIKRADAEPLYRVALEAVVQVLLLVGPVMGQWRKVGFSREFELLDRVIDRLNSVSNGPPNSSESAR